MTKVLHLFSNAKWTGPAEPALNLCLALRALGVEADFACAPDAGKSINMVVETARERGMEPLLRFHLTKHRHPIKNLLDKRALGKFLRKNPYDLIHCHLDNDHDIAIRPAHKLGIPVIRTSYEGNGFKKDFRHQRLLADTAALIEPSRMALAYDAHAFDYPVERMRVIPNAVDTERFASARDLPDGRSKLGVPSDAFVVGIVARMQTHRHYRDFFQALRMLADLHSNVHAIIVGRGTNQDAVCQHPVQEFDLASRVHFAGFVQGDDYVGMLKAFDAKVYLVPGSDGTCRAVREAMAMEKPAVVADRGMLGEIVTHGVNGLVFDGSAEALFGALNALAGSRSRTREFGAAARETAETSYSLPAQAKAVLKLYEEVCSAR